MTTHDIVVIGTSAGGVEALRELVRALPEDLPAAVFVVMHIGRDSVSVLPKILGRVGPLPVAHAVDCEPIEIGRIYVAPPDHHLLLKEGSLSVVNGPTENRHLPAIDPMFRSAARVYGPRVIGVVLTGASDDGVSGLRAIKSRGGLAVVQDPDDAQQPDLPRNALEFVDVDHTVPIASMGGLLDALVRLPAPDVELPPSETLNKESRIAEFDLDAIEDERRIGAPSAFSCPDCGGVLWEVEHSDFLRFRCRVGHAYSALSLAGVQRESFERGLWAALRALEENASFSRRLSVRARRAGQGHVAERFMVRAEESSANAEAIREMILRLGVPTAETPN